MNSRQQRLVVSPARVNESAFGDFRRADPKNAPKPFIAVHKAAKAYFDTLAPAMNKIHAEEVVLLHALHGLAQAIQKAGFDPEEVAADSMMLRTMLRDVERMPHSVSHAHILEMLRKYLKSEDMTLGTSSVHS